MPVVFYSTVERLFYFSFFCRQLLEGVISQVYPIPDSLQRLPSISEDSPDVKTEPSSSNDNSNNAAIETFHKNKEAKNGTASSTSCSVRTK